MNTLVIGDTPAYDFCSYSSVLETSGVTYHSCLTILALAFSGQVCLFTL